MVKKKSKKGIFQKSIKRLRGTGKMIFSMFKNRLSKARNAFAILRPVWLLSVYSLRTKLHLYNSIVKSVLWYGSECLQVVETDFN